MLSSPTEFGLPSKYNVWRPYQDEACEAMVCPTPRFLLQICPTGFGKSITYMTAAMISPGRTIILTSTKGLQTQLMNDFGHMAEVVEMRGRGNYACRLNTRVNCDMGLCMFGMKCTMKEEGGCFYFDQLRKARHAKIVITNYAYWMSQNEYSEGMGDFDMMILDEAHSAPDHVINHVSVVFGKRDWTNKMLELNDSLPNDIYSWKMWAKEKLHEVRADIESAKARRKEKLFFQLKSLEKKLVRLSEGMDSSWVWEDNPANVTLTPTWPAPFSEKVLFLGIPKVVLTSATVVPKTANLMGIPKSEMEKEEYPHSFPLINRPLIHIPTVRMNYKNGEMEHRLWVNKVDQIIRDRLDTKGVIHTISYARKDMLIERSKYSEYMLTHNKRDTESVVRTFKRSAAPCILVSPSMATGWDFPDSECRWQIIVKLPYPDMRGNIMKTRSRMDKDYIAYIVAQQLIQATGRGVRSVEDWCETFITDNNIEWFLPQNKHLMVEWFQGAYKMNRTIPQRR